LSLPAPVKSILGVLKKEIIVRRQENPKERGSKRKKNQTPSPGNGRARVWGIIWGKRGGGEEEPPKPLLPGHNEKK